MVLVLTVFDRQAQFREFSCWLTELEFGFQLLNFIVTIGDHLLKAELIDNGKSTPLPVEAFDGQCLLNPIQGLEAEWVALLSKPVQWESIRKRQFADLVRRQKERYGASIDRTKRAIQLTEQHLDQIKGKYNSDEIRQCRAIQQYETLLDHYQRHLAQFETRQKASFNQLTQLNI